jgi:hypothetical protein
MRVEQTQWRPERGWTPHPPGRLDAAPQLVLLFGGTALLADPHAWLPAIEAAYPQAHRFGCSTAGEIAGTKVTDDWLVATAVHFEHSTIAGAQTTIRDTSESFAAGAKLARTLDAKGLVHVLVLSDGIDINGSQLVSGLSSELPPGVTVTGGLSGDGTLFKRTLVIWDGPPAGQTVAVVGLYGPRLRVGYGSLGGWDPFGPERRITDSRGNVLYELDGRSALDLYKQYLGEHARELPASALLFPLSLRLAAGEEPVVRTILAIDEREQSMTFAGDMPMGATAQLMKANFDRLIDGATGAASASRQALGRATTDLALLISCVGRKVVLKQRIEEEVEAVRDVLGEAAVLTGFYSYGEISPFTPGARCELHNQTMTITTLCEA